MIFDQEKYYKYTKKLEKYVIAIYIVLILIGVVMGYWIGDWTTYEPTKGLIIGGLIGFFLANLYTITIKIKIQKMNWEMEIYNIVKKKEIT